jgi:hypothetical protein
MAGDLLKVNAPVRFTKIVCSYVEKNPIVVHISCHLSAEAKTEESVILVLARNGHHIPAVIGQIHEHASHRYEPQEHAPHKYILHGACTSWGVCLIGVCLIGRVPHRCVPHRACAS